MLQLGGLVPVLTVGSPKVRLVGKFYACVDQKQTFLDK